MSWTQSSCEWCNGTAIITTRTATSISLFSYGGWLDTRRGTQEDNGASPLASATQCKRKLCRVLVSQCKRELRRVLVLYANVIERWMDTRRGTQKDTEASPLASATRCKQELRRVLVLYANVKEQKAVLDHAWHKILIQDRDEDFTSYLFLLYKLILFFTFYCFWVLQTILFL